MSFKKADGKATATLFKIEISSYDKSRKSRQKKED